MPKNGLSDVKQLHEGAQYEVRRECGLSVAISAMLVHSSAAQNLATTDCRLKANGWSRGLACLRSMLFLIGRIEQPNSG